MNYMINNIDLEIATKLLDEINNTVRENNEITDEMSVTLQRKAYTAFRNINKGAKFGVRKILMTILDKDELNSIKIDCHVYDINKITIEIDGVKMYIYVYNDDKDKFCIMDLDENKLYVDMTKVSYTTPLSKFFQIASKILNSNTICEDLMYMFRDFSKLWDEAYQICAKFGGEYIRMNAVNNIDLNYTVQNIRLNKAIKENKPVAVQFLMENSYKDQDYFIYNYSCAIVFDAYKNQPELMKSVNIEYIDATKLNIHSGVLTRKRKRFLQ